MKANVSFDEGVAFFKRLSFGWRLSFIAGMIATIVITTLSVLSYLAYKSDKIPYLMELHEERVKSLAFRTRAALEQKIFACSDSAGSAAASCARLEKLESLQDATRWKMPRFPNGTEIFVGQKDGQKVVVGRFDNVSLWVKPLPLSLSWQPEDEVAWALTTDSLFLGSSRPELISDKNVTSQPAVQEFLKTGLASGLRRGTSGQKEDVFSGFQEVPGTNVVIFLETPLDGAFAPLKRFLSVVFFAALVSLWIVFAVGSYFFDELVRPLRQVGANVKALLVGNELEHIVTHSQDELAEMNNDLQLLAQKITQSAQKLMVEQARRKACFDFVKALSEAWTQTDALRMVAKSLREGLHWTAQADLDLYLLPHSADETTDGEQFWRARLMNSGEIVQDPSGEWEAATSEQGNDIRTFLKEAKPRLTGEQVWIPLLFGAIPLGFFVLHQLPAESRLERSDAEWLMIFAAGLAQALWFLPPAVQAEANA